jgi:hypothetical protein
MSEIGIVEGSIVQSPQAGVQLNAKPFRNAALAKGKLAAGAADAVGGLFQDVADKIAQNRNARQVFDADLAMRKTYDNFNAQLVNMPDEGTWLPAWKEQTQKLRDQVMDNPHLAPDVKRQLDMKFDAWEEATTSATNTAALLKGHTESRKSALTDATYAANQGHVDGAGGANDIMAAAVANHAFSPQEAAVITKRFPDMAAKANADQAIVRFPIESRQIIEGAKWFKDLTPSNQKSVLAAADTAKKRAQGQNYDAMLQEKIDSNTGQVPEGMIRQAIDTKQIEAKTGENLIAAQKREDEKADDGQFKYVSALAHDPTAWRAQKPEDYAAFLRQESANIKSPTVRQKAVDDINRELDAVHKDGFTSDGPKIRTQLEMMKQSYSELTSLVPTGNKNNRGVPFLKGGLERLETMSAADFREAYGSKANRSEVMKREAARQTDARDWYTQATSEYLDWAHSEKGEAATPQEAEAERTRLGFGTYSSVVDVIRDFQAGKIDAATCKKIGLIRFGIE